MNSGNAVVKAVRNFLSVGVLFLCAGSVALAQAGRGSISGLVADPGGAIVQGAQVVLRNPATGVTQHTVTTSAGLYTFISLNPGVYQVTASQAECGSSSARLFPVDPRPCVERSRRPLLGACVELM